MLLLLMLRDLALGSTRFLDAFLGVQYCLDDGLNGYNDSNRSWMVMESPKEVDIWWMSILMWRI